MTTDAEFFEAVKAQEDETTFKPRGRGRSTSAKFKITDVRKNMATLLTSANNGVKSFTKFGAYALNADEIKVLADALAAEIEASPKLQKLASGAAKVGPHMQLIQACGLIFLPRYLAYMADKGGQQATQEQPEDDGSYAPYAQPEYPAPVGANGIGPAGEAPPAHLWGG